MKKYQNEVESLLDAEKWGEARMVLFKAIKEYPEEYFLYSRISLTFYEEKNYETALEYSKIAYSMQPNDPIIQWDYAGALSMNNEEELAIKIWQKIIDKPLEELAYGEFGEGIRAAKSLYNDTIYRIGYCYFTINNLDLAIEFIQKHIDNRQRGIPSLYLLSSIKKELSRIIRDQKNQRYLRSINFV